MPLCKARLALDSAGLPPSSLQIGLNVPEKLWADITETSMGIGAFIVIAAARWVQAHYNLKVQGRLSESNKTLDWTPDRQKAEIVREILDTTHTP